MFDLFGRTKSARSTEDDGQSPSTVFQRARPRRIAVVAGHRLVRISRAATRANLDLETKQVEEFTSPGGRASLPYGITTTADGAVWQRIRGVAEYPRALDPATSTFQNGTSPTEAVSCDIW